MAPSAGNRLGSDVKMSKEGNDSSNLVPDMRIHHTSPTGQFPKQHVHEPKRHTVWRRLLLLSAAMWSLGLLATGIVLGQWLEEPPTAIEPEIVLNVDAGIADDVQPILEADLIMPGIIGLPIAEARAVLADYGIDETLITLVEVSWAGDPGIVTVQEPVAGTRSPQSVNLSVSVPASMPDLAGQTREEAERVIEGLGGRPIFRQEYVPEATPGTVVSTSPPQGSAMTELITVTLASRPASVFLVDLRSVDTDCSIDSVKVNGVQSQRAIYCRLSDSSPPKTADWDLSRKSARFTARVGLSDDSAIDAVARLEVIIDGKVARTLDIKFGTITDIDLSTVDALRLQLRVTTIGTLSKSSRLVLLDASLLGADTDITSLSGSS